MRRSLTHQDKSVGYTCRMTLGGITSRCVLLVGVIMRSRGNKGTNFSSKHYY